MPPGALLPLPSCAACMPSPCPTVAGASVRPRQQRGVGVQAGLLQPRCKGRVLPDSGQWRLRQAGHQAVEAAQAGERRRLGCGHSKAQDAEWDELNPKHGVRLAVLGSWLGHACNK